MIKNEKKSPALSKQIEETVEWLSSFGKTNNNGVTRPLYTDNWVSAQHALEQRMNEIGLNAYFDDVGNLFGRLEGTLKEDDVILTGSHIDSVINGGKYDGAYGVIAGLIALQYLKKEYGCPKKNIEVVSLCEEEGSRFPMTYWGSGSIVGIKSAEDIQHLKDSQGTSFVEAMNTAGFGLGIHRNPLRNDLNCFIELHVEQGQVLELEGKSIGLVSHIVGQKRFTITVTGESNHAGTTPMNYRKDAMHAATEMIYQLLQKAKETSPELVCTVGQITLDPNIPNVIPGKATFSIDTRHPDEEVLSSFCDEVFKEFTSITNNYSTQLHIDNWMNEKPVKMSEHLNEVTESILTKENVSFKKMTSGAGHDSQVFGQYCPTSLLFVPSHKGMSHSPLEYTSTEDLENGIHLLIKVLHELAY